MDIPPSQFCSEPSGTLFGFGQSTGYCLRTQFAILANRITGKCQDLAQFVEARSKQFLIPGVTDWLHRRLNEPHDEIPATVLLLPCVQSIKQSVSFGRRRSGVRNSHVTEKLADFRTRKSSIGVSQYITNALKMDCSELRNWSHALRSVSAISGAVMEYQGSN